LSQEITINEMIEIVTPLFKKYGFKTAYLVGQDIDIPIIVTTKVKFLVEDSNKSTKIDLLGWYKMVQDFENHLQRPCQIVDMDELKTDNYLLHEVNTQSLLIYKDDFIDIKNEITLEDIIDITKPLFQQYGFKAAYLCDYDISKTKFINETLKFIVEEYEDSTSLDILEWYKMVHTFEDHLNMNCHIVLAENLGEKSILIYQDMGKDIIEYKKTYNNPLDLYSPVDKEVFLEIINNLIFKVNRLYVTSDTAMLCKFKHILIKEYQALYNAIDEKEIIDIKKRVQVIGQLLNAEDLD
jgi:hypothetical protein